MRTVVITGASGNLGKAVAQVFAKDKLVLMDVKSGVNLLEMESIQAALKQGEPVTQSLAGRLGRPCQSPPPTDTAATGSANHRTRRAIAEMVIAPEIIRPELSGRPNAQPRGRRGANRSSCGCSVPACPARGTPATPVDRDSTVGYRPR